MPRGQKNQQNIKNQKQYCNKFNKDFKNGPHQTNLKKKKNMHLSSGSRSEYSFAIFIVILELSLGLSVCLRATLYVEKCCKAHV